MILAEKKDTLREYILNNLNEKNHKAMADLMTENNDEKLLKYQKMDNN